MQRKRSNLPLKRNNVSAVKPAGATALDGNEIDRLFAPMRDTGHLALAVSGGPDSMALMEIAWLWCRDGNDRPRLTALTVDHRLRDQSAAEARFVKQTAEAHGIAHVTLHWTGRKPKTGLQEAARNTRYSLMCAWCRANDAQHLLTAHTIEDQAETVLMRLARGSGVDGLAGIMPSLHMHGIMVSRPLLSVSRRRLVATLKQAGRSYVEDPSNRDRRFERVRVREIMPALAQIGCTPEAVAQTASRLRMASNALDTVTDNVLRHACTVYEAGYCTLDIAALREQPRDIIRRVLERALMAIGGLAHPPRYPALSTLADWLDGPDGRARTLGGCRIARQNDQAIVAREFGRISQDKVVLRSGDTVIWDNRFAIALRATEDYRLSIGPLGTSGWAELKHALAQAGSPQHELPAFVAHSLPACRRSDRLAFVPALGFDRLRREGNPVIAFSTMGLERLAAARFVPLAQASCNDSGQGRIPEAE